MLVFLINSSDFFLPPSDLKPFFGLNKCRFVFNCIFANSKYRPRYYIYKSLKMSYSFLIGAYFGVPPSTPLGGYRPDPLPSRRLKWKPGTTFPLFCESLMCSLLCLCRSQSRESGWRRKRRLSPSPLSLCRRGTSHGTGPPF